MVATQLRIGMTILHEGEPYRILSVEHVTPGKGRGMVQTKLRDLRTSATREYRFRSEDKIDMVRLEQHEMEFLYNSESEYYFMNTENYEQISLPEEDIKEEAIYMIPNVKIVMEFYEGKPVGVEPPLVVELKVVDTPPHIKGATATNSLKAATLETGLIVNVPSFVEIGDVVRIDTREGKYLERVLHRKTQSSLMS